MKKQDWGNMLQLAHIRFGLDPARFWALSVREWQWLCGTQTPAFLGSGGLRALMQQYPDEKDHD